MTKTFDSTGGRIARCSERMPDYPTQLVTLSRLAYHIQKRSQDQLNAALKKHGLTTVSYTALMVLYGSKEETQRASDLGEACSEKLANMTRICNELEQQGLIKRRSGVEDRRSVTITLTAGGRKRVEQLAPVYWGILNQTYVGINERELRQHETLLKQQLANLEASHQA
jgi:MarR family transcriptional repressor of emrRAB